MASSSNRRSSRGSRIADRGLTSVAGSGVPPDPLPRRPGLHVLREMGVPFGNQTRGTIANVVKWSLFSLHRYVFTNHLNL